MGAGAMTNKEVPPDHSSNQPQEHPPERLPDNSPANPAETQAVKSMPSALANPNLRLYFGGQVVSMIGTWMQQMALSWLIYRLTNSTYMLGVVAFASQAPTFLLTPFAGIVADRVNRKRLVIITQSLAML